VLVGYQADDPPLRYLLEALEADRERYPDLQQVYAFASYPAGEKELTAALWEAKGVQPILYAIENGDHSPLYRTLREWKRYADDPTAWRAEQLREIFNEPAAAVEEERIEECLALLRHGDAPRLLGELSPEAEWLPLLAGRRVFDGGKAHPGDWIAKRLNDPEMIRACADLPAFDSRTHQQIDRAVEHRRETLPPIRHKAWQLILTAKRSSPSEDLDEAWYRAARTVRQGEAGFDVRQLVARILRPRLKIRQPWRNGVEAAGPEALHQLVRIEFGSERRPTPDEILQIWPQVLDQEVALFRVLERALTDALEEASDVGFLERPDRANWDVPSVAAHPQNAYRSGFYPITRALADLWQRIAAQDHERARTLAVGWRKSPFLLARRLYLYALSSQDIFTSKEARSAVLTLSDDDFWLTGAQVEIMRLLAGRWNEFSKEDSEALEARLAEGIPRDLFPADAFKIQERWESIWDAAVFKRLKRVSAAGGELSAASHHILDEISARHPSWMEEKVRQGPFGHPELLANITDDALVKEAIRLQRERPFEGDVWRLFCSADPDRALRALRLEADAGEWKVEAWQPLLWAAGNAGKPEFQFELADLLARMPDEFLRELLSSAIPWLQKRRETFTANDRPGGPRFLPLWDRFAALTYSEAGEAEVGKDDDLLVRALGEPGGMLAQVLLDSLSALKPEAGTGLGLELTPRFDRVARAGGRAGILGRVVLAGALAYIDGIDPVWAEENLVSRLAWSHPEAPALWKAQAVDRIGSARLFNALRPAMLEAFEREVLSDFELEGLVGKLLDVALWHRQGGAGHYELPPADIRRVLTIGPSIVRQHAAWQLRRLMGETDGLPADKAERWRTVVGPLFRDIWPLDAKLRTEATSENLVLMALRCEGAFPDAVEAIVDVVVPYQLYAMSTFLGLEQPHDLLVSEHPVAFVRLANALIDPAAYTIPSDLATLLQECVSANPQIVNDPGYIRLFGLRRLRGA
jgi:hypothetical protein